MINKSKEQLVIEDELKINPKDYKLYEELGDCLKNTNKYQSYLCYENGAFFCGNSNERIRLLKKKDEMGAEGYKVPKSAMVILNYNLRQITEVFERSFITEKDVLESVESNSCVVKNWYFIYSKSLDEKIVDLTSEISKRYQEERKDEINISTIWMEISRK